MSLVYVDGCEVGGTPLFAGIWRKSAAGLPVVKLGMNDAHYQAELDAMVKAGLRLQRTRDKQQPWKRKFAARDFRQDAPGIAPENRRTAY